MTNFLLIEQLKFDYHIIGQWFNDSLGQKSKKLAQIAPKKRSDKEPKDSVREDWLANTSD